MGVEIGCITLYYTINHPAIGVPVAPQISHPPPPGWAHRYTPLRSARPAAASAPRRASFAGPPPRPGEAAAGSWPWRGSGEKIYGKPIGNP